MKTVILFFSLFLQFASAQAAVPAAWTNHQKDFALNSNFGAGHKVYYDCDNAEMVIEQQLMQMGAANIQVQCQGGIDWALPSTAWNAYITMSYSTLQLPASGDTATVSADWKQVNIRSFDNCALMNQIFDETKDSFEMQNLVTPGHCMRPDSSFRLSFMTLAPL